MQFWVSLPLPGLACVPWQVIPAWETTAGTEAGQQAATDAVLGELTFAWFSMYDMTGHTSMRAYCWY